MSPPSPTSHPGLLFTAFEPSGDAHAAPVIAELKRRRPDLSIHAWGGPKMRAAGAEIIEITGDRAAMGAGGFAKIREHLAINRRIETWLRDHPVKVHIPVDSPAANFPICKLTRAAGCRVVHLVAPQLWAWAPWRVKKLRRLTDLVLCLLPFETEYFTSRNVPVKFIGHPVMWGEEAGPQRREEDAPLPHGSPHIAILPGSRPAEIEKNLLPMAHVYEDVKAQHPAATAVIAAAAPILADAIRHRLQNSAVEARVEVDRLAEILSWADLAIVCSGTATLDVTRSETPMVVMYRINPIPWWLIGRWLMSTKLRALPNLVAGHRAVPEFIPSYGPLQPICAAANAALDEDHIRRGQIEALRGIKAKFREIDPAGSAAEEILRFVDE